MRRLGRKLNSFRHTVDERTPAGPRSKPGPGPPRGSSNGWPLGPVDGPSGLEHREPHQHRSLRPDGLQTSLRERMIIPGDWRPLCNGNRLPAQRTSHSPSPAQRAGKGPPHHVVRRPNGPTIPSPNRLGRAFPGHPNRVRWQTHAFTHPIRGAAPLWGRVTGGVASLNLRLISLTPTGVDAPRLRQRAPQNRPLGGAPKPASGLV